MSLRQRLADFIAPTPRQEAAQAEMEGRRSPAQKQEIVDMIRSTINASYDTVHKTRENERHWQYADFRAADASLDPYVRESLRSQSRYELQENNSYGRGFVETIVTDTIGSGPRLQITEFDQKTNQEVEASWHRWCKATDFDDDLITDRTARLVDGESVIRFINNLSIDDPVQMDIQLIECDQLRSPKYMNQIDQFYVDGVHLDRFGNPFAYDILQHHPGQNYWTAADMWAYDMYPLDQIIHSFRRNRPGQHRGVPEFAPALPLFAFLRRFTLATVSAAETAASVSQVVETDAPIPEDLEEEYTIATFEKYLDTIPIDRNSATVLPNMWKLKQFAAEHPTTTYQMFKRELIAEIGRCLCLPVNVGALDSGSSNFSSAKFDWLGYERKIKLDQTRIARRTLDRVFCEWIIEASLIGSIPRRAANKVLSLWNASGKRGLVGQIQHEWYWDGLRDADQNDAANAQKTRLQNGSTHRAREYAVQGLDIEVEDRKAAEGFGVSVEQYREWVMASIFTNGNLLQQQAQAELDGENDNGEEDTQESDSSSQTATA